MGMNHAQLVAALELPPGFTLVGREWDFDPVEAVYEWQGMPERLRMAHDSDLSGARIFWYGERPSVHVSRKNWEAIQAELVASGVGDWPPPSRERPPAGENAERGVDRSPLSPPVLPTPASATPASAARHLLAVLKRYDLEASADPAVVEFVEGLF